MGKRARGILIGISLIIIRIIIKSLKRKSPKSRTKAYIQMKPRSSMKLKKIKVQERRLNKYLGYAYPEENLVEITPNQKPRQYLDTLIHELLHIMYPDDSETKISRNASTITHHIWKKGYRRH